MILMIAFLALFVVVWWVLATITEDGFAAFWQTVWLAVAISVVLMAWRAFA